MNEKSRSAVCRELAYKCLHLLEQQTTEVAETLEGGMEVDHFLALLNNMLAININMKYNIRDAEKKTTTDWTKWIEDLKNESNV